MSDSTVTLFKEQAYNWHDTQLNIDWTVSVPTKGIWQQAIPKQVYAPVIYIELYKGPTEADIEKSIQEDKEQGIVQLYEDHAKFLANTTSRHFMRLEDVTSIKCRQTINISGGGQCNISIQNDLTKHLTEPTGRELNKFLDIHNEELEGALPDDAPWERTYYKSGRFNDGTIVRYMDSVDGKWYRGQLHVNEPGDNEYGLRGIELDELSFYVTWLDNRFPADAMPINGLRSDRFFCETLGEPIVEPMMKVKIYAKNRFSTSLLTQYGYEASFDVTDTDLPEYGFSCIFTGYVSGISHHREGATYTIDIMANDVMSWLSYSTVNMNPSLNILQLDFDPHSQFNAQWSDFLKITKTDRANWQLYTTRFAGMPAHEIIRALFLGLKMGKVKNLSDEGYEGIYIYGKPEDVSSVDSKPILDGDNEPIVFKNGQEVVIHDQYPLAPEIATAYLLGYKQIIDPLNQNRWLEGWASVDNIELSNTIFSGIGSFVEDVNPALRVHPVSLPAPDLIKDFSSDKITIYPSIEDPSASQKDQYVSLAYRAFIRDNPPLVQSTYRDRRSIAKEVTDLSFSNCYADGSGRVWFHPVWAYQDITSPIYVVQPEEVQGWSIDFSDKQIVTIVIASGQTDLNIMDPIFIGGVALARKELIRQFGVRIIQTSNPNVTTGPSAIEFARSAIERINADTTAGSVTITMRPELQLARNVYLPWLNLIGYISGLDHKVDFGKGAHTTIGLKYVRHPWTPWVPITFRSKIPGFIVPQDTTYNGTTATTTNRSSDRDPFSPSTEFQGVSRSRLQPTNAATAFLGRRINKADDKRELADFATALVQYVNSKDAASQIIKLPKLVAVVSQPSLSKATFSENHPYNTGGAIDITFEPNTTFSTNAEHDSAWLGILNAIAGLIPRDQYIWISVTNKEERERFWARYGKPIAGNDDADRIVILLKD